MKYVTKVQPVKLLQITEICDGIFVEKYIKLTGGKFWANVNIQFFSIGFSAVKSLLIFIFLV